MRRSVLPSSDLPRLCSVPWPSKGAHAGLRDSVCPLHFPKGPIEGRPRLGLHHSLRGGERRPTPGTTATASPSATDGFRRCGLSITAQLSLQTEGLPCAQHSEQISELSWQLQYMVALNTSSSSTTTPEECATLSPQAEGSTRAIPMLWHNDCRPQTSSEDLAEAARTLTERTRTTPVTFPESRYDFGGLHSFPAVFTTR